ncbi:MAG: DUF4129 domain-containing protein [Actinomycetota bacterium]|nr:DUF4129 domain-containing protein [Actinomycetota bacterium]
MESVRTEPASLEARSVPAAVLAAVAESGPIFLPLRFVAEQSVLGAKGGPLDSYPLFVAVFAGGAALATVGRRSRAFAPVLAVAAIALGVAQARTWGAGDFGAVAIAVLLSLAVGVRVATLALRDWRDPIHVSFGVLTGVLLLEAVLAQGGGWTSLVALVTPIFFVASLGSRAASLRIGDAEGLQTGGPAAGQQWGRILAAMAVGALALLGVAALLGDQARALEHLGRFIPLAVYGLIYGATVVASVVLRPIGWILSKLGFHVGAIQQLLRHLPRFRHRAGHALNQSGPSGVSLRVIGLLALAGIGALLVWLIVRQRRLWILQERAEPEAPPELSRPVQPAVATGRRKRRPRGELPDDTVRRLYAETLLALQSWGAARPPHRTPGEYLREVTVAIPASAPGFTALTRAYEDVRYGSRAFDRTALDVLEVQRDSVLEAVRRAPPPERATSPSGER